MITVTVRYYNRLKDLAFTNTEKLQVDDGATIQDLVNRIICVRPSMAPLQDSLLTARNNEYVTGKVTLNEGDAIDLMPPVSGG